MLQAMMSDFRSEWRNHGQHLHFGVVEIAPARCLLIHSACESPILKEVCKPTLNAFCYSWQTGGLKSTNLSRIASVRQYRIFSGGGGVFTYVVALTTEGGQTPLPPVNTYDRTIRILALFLISVVVFT